MEADHMTGTNHAVRAPVPVSVLAHSPVDDIGYEQANGEEAVTPDSDSHEEKKLGSEVEYPKEKKPEDEVNVAVEELGEIYDVKSGDPIPEVPGMPEESQQLTIRAIVIGCILGCVVQASNIYLGLKTGFTFGPQLFGAIVGFAVLKPLSRILPAYLGGGYFGPKENVTVQTAATAAGGLGIIYVTGIPAMYQLGLLGKTPQDDFGRLIALTAVSAFYGMMFAIPLRKWYILKQKLVFPTPTATAFTIRSLHSGPSGALAARKKAKCLVFAFAGAITLRVVSEYAPGILWDWHIFWWLSTWGWTAAAAPDNWGWFFEWTPAFFGAGILSGVNASLSFWGGSVLAWGIIGPALVLTGKAAGKAPYPDYPQVRSYYSMAPTDPTSNSVSPRYWLLWPGVLIMMAASFTEIFTNGKSIYTGLRLAYLNLVNKVALARGREGRALGENEKEVVDPSPKQDQVPTWAWGSGVVICAVLTCVVLGLCFEVNVGLSVLAIVLGFLFSFIGVQSAGDTDINPISTCAKASQLIIGGASRGFHYAVDPVTGANVHAQRVNLLSGVVAGAAAAQTTDMTGDLKTGHLLGAKPRNQFVAQFAGAICSIFLSTGLYVLFVAAYPCINDASAEKCEFSLPSVGAWRAVAVAVTSENGLPLPTSSGITALVLGIFTVFYVIYKNVFLPKKYKQYMPNANAIGLAFVLNSTTQPTAMAFASLLAHWWKVRNPGGYDMYAFALAAGFMSGEGLGGVVNAIFSVANISGAIHGSSVGCPANDYCG